MNIDLLLPLSKQTLYTLDARFPKSSRYLNFGSPSITLTSKLVNKLQKSTTQDQEISFGDSIISNLEDQSESITNQFKTFTFEKTVTSQTQSKLPSLNLSKIRQNLIPPTYPSSLRELNTNRQVGQIESYVQKDMSSRQKLSDLQKTFISRQYKDEIKKLNEKAVKVYDQTYKKNTQNHVFQNNWNLLRSQSQFQLRQAKNEKLKYYIYRKIRDQAGNYNSASYKLEKWKTYFMTKNFNEEIEKQKQTDTVNFFKKLTEELTVKPKRKILVSNQHNNVQKVGRSLVKQHIKIQETDVDDIRTFSQQQRYSNRIANLVKQRKNGAEYLKNMQVLPPQFIFETTR